MSLHNVCEVRFRPAVQLYFVKLQMNSSAFWCRTVPLEWQPSGIPGSNPPKGGKHTNLLSTEFFGLASRGHQPKCHMVCVGFGWSSAEFCLAVKFAQQDILLSSFTKSAQLKEFETTQGMK